MKFRELIEAAIIEDVYIGYCKVTRYEDVQISGISEKSFTLEGQEEWADILDATVYAICKDHILLEGCDPQRIFRFAQCFECHTTWENYTLWFTGDY